MRPRTLLVLTLVVAALVAFIWFVERDLPSSEERVEQAKRVLALEADAVETLTIEWQDDAAGSTGAGTVVELGRERQPTSPDIEAPAPTEDAWRLRRPMVARADAAAISSLLAQLADLRKERTLEQVTRQDVGLAAPRARVTLSLPQETYVLEIGAEIPASGNMTLAVEGREEVYVVADSIWSMLTKSPGEWRDKALFTADRGDIERLTLSTDGRRIVLARRGEAFWIEAPLVDRADEQSVDALLTAVTGLRAESFVDESADGIETGLGRPFGSLEIDLRGVEQPLRLDLGAPSTGTTTAGEAVARYARIGEQVVLIKAALAESFERRAQDWRSLDWTVSQVYQVERAVVTDGTGSLELRRDGGNWLRDGVEIAYGPATDLLFEIAGARALQLIDGAADGLGEPELTVTLESDNGNREVVELFAPRPDGVPARASDRQVVLLLSADVAANVRAKVADLRAASPDALAPDDLGAGSDG